MSSLGQWCPAEFHASRAVKKAPKTSDFEFSKAMEGNPLFAKQPPSSKRQSGRRLILKFNSPSHPELDRAEYHDRSGARPGYWQQGDADPDHRMGWTAVPQSLSLLFLSYLEAAFAGRDNPFRFYGTRTASPAASIGNAICQNRNKLHNLFADYTTGHRISRVDKIFDGDHLNGKDKERDNRCIMLKSEELPADSIEVYLDHRRLECRGEVEKLMRALCKSLGVGDLKATEQKSPPPQPAPPTPEAQPALALKVLAEAPMQPPPPASPKPAEEPKQEPKAAASKEYFPRQTPRVIPAELLRIQNPRSLVWNDKAPLLNFSNGVEGADDIWRIEDACRGALILGSPGSGKTSGSGFALAGAMLRSDFGGLVLTAKPDEAVRWVRLCHHFGRYDDCVLIGPDKDYRINIFDYEIQRPVDRVNLADDLVAFMLLFTELISKNKDSRSKDRFWEEAPKRLMRRLFETFLLAGDAIDVNVLSRFLSYTPVGTVADWRKIPIGEVLARAERNIKSEDDRLDFEKCLDYWTVQFARVIPEITRGGIIESFLATADVLGGRGVRELLCSDTNFTPECILSGKIAVLCFPIKENDHSGLMIQTAWKHLFQKAIERRADKGLAGARPVFLWEDEGHLFYNKYDSNFQATARDCRAAHVILSQNLNNFYRLGHSQHDVKSVFGSMNTHLYHANGDSETNQWFSKRLGQELRGRKSSSSSTAHSSPDSKADSPPGQEGSQHTTSSGRTESWEPVVRAEKLETLKMAGDGTCQAVVHWLGHSFAGNKGRNWTVTMFDQDNINYNPT